MRDALLAVAAWLALATSHPLERAVVCADPAAGGAVAGGFVGETAERVYIGEEDRTSGGRGRGTIVSIPGERVLRVVLGKAETSVCRPG